MNEITKVSEITYEDIANYIRLVEVTNEDQTFLNTILKVSKNFIKDYTGHTLEELDDYPDFIIVVYVLCQDMYDNRALYVDKSNLNNLVETILGMHSDNLLPSVEND